MPDVKIILDSVIIELMKYTDKHKVQWWIPFSGISLAICHPRNLQLLLLTRSGLRYHLERELMFSSFLTDLARVFPRKLLPRKLISRLFYSGRPRSDPGFSENIVKGISPNRHLQSN